MGARQEAGNRYLEVMERLMVQVVHDAASVHLREALIDRRRPGKRYLPGVVHIQGKRDFGMGNGGLYEDFPYQAQLGAG